MYSCETELFEVELTICKTMRTNRIVDLAFLADYSVKIKQSEKRDKYLDFARGLRMM